MIDAYADLMQALPVEGLVPGDPVAVDQLAQTLLRWSDLFADAARALRRIDVVWTGQAAEAFEAEFRLQPAAFASAATAMSDAGYAVGSYGIAFDSARASAGVALEIFRRGVRAGLAARAALSVAAGAFLPTSGPVDLRTEPAGLQDRLAGVEKLTAAREALRVAGDRAASSLRDAMAGAPPQVSALQHGANFAAGPVMPWAWNEENVDFAAGGVRGLLDLGAMAAMPAAMPAAPLVMGPVNRALDDLEWRWNVGTASGFHQAGALVAPAVATWGVGGVAGTDARAPQLLAGRILPKGVNSAPVDLYAFGNTTRPTAPRLTTDMTLDSEGWVIPEVVDWPRGKSTFMDPKLAPLTGQYHLLPEGTPMPFGLRVLRDGSEVEGPHGPGHATIYPIVRMTPEQFRELVLGLPWQHSGRIK